MTLNIPDISEGHALPNLASQDGIILRACLGATKVDAEYRVRLAEARRDYPTKPLATYVFLTGPNRGNGLVKPQIDFYANLAATPGGKIVDWENDVYKGNDGKMHSYGQQPFEAVIQALDYGRFKYGIDAGLYASLGLLTRPVVAALVKRKTPLLWVAAYDGLDVPDYILDSGMLIGHQYTGTSLDRSHFFFPEADWARFCGVVDAHPHAPKVTGHAVVHKGSWWDYRVSGTEARGYTASRTLRRTGGFSADTTTIIPFEWGGKDRRFARLATGSYTGSWVDLNDVPEVFWSKAA